MSKKWRCDGCGRTFRSKRGLSLHKRYCTANSPPESEEIKDTENNAVDELTTEERTEITNEIPTTETGNEITLNEDKKSDDTAQKGADDTHEEESNATTTTHHQTEMTQDDILSAVSTALENILGPMFSDLANKINPTVPSLDAEKVERGSVEDGGTDAREIVVNHTNNTDVTPSSIEYQVNTSVDEIAEKTVTNTQKEVGDGTEDRTEDRSEEEADEDQTVPEAPPIAYDPDIIRRIEKLETSEISLRESIDERRIEQLNERIDVLEGEVKDTHGFYENISSLEGRVKHLEDAVHTLKESLKEYIETYTFFNLAKIPPKILQNVYEVTLNDVVSSLITTFGESDAEKIVNDVLEDVRGRTTGSEIFHYYDRKFYIPELVNTIENQLLTVGVIQLTYQQIIDSLIQYLPSYKKPEFHNIIRVKSQEYAIEKATKSDHAIHELKKAVDDLSTENNTLRAEIDSVKSTLLGVLDDSLALNTQVKNTTGKLHSELDIIKRDMMQLKEGRSTTMDMGVSAEAEDDVVTEEQAPLMNDVEEALETPDILEPEVPSEEPGRDAVHSQTTGPDMGVLILGDEDDADEGTEGETPAREDGDSMIWSPNAKDTEAEMEPDESNVPVIEQGVAVIGDDEDDEVTGSDVSASEDGNSLIRGPNAKDAEADMETESDAPVIEQGVAVIGDDKDKSSKKKSSTTENINELEQVREIILAVLIANNGGTVSKASIKAGVRRSGLTGRGLSKKVENTLKALVEEGRVRKEGRNYTIVLERPQANTTSELSEHILNILIEQNGKYKSKTALKKALKDLFPGKFTDKELMEALDALIETGKVEKGGGRKGYRIKENK